jgi:hypothetical protein
MGKQIDFTDGKTTMQQNNMPEEIIVAYLEAGKVCPACTDNNGEVVCMVNCAICGSGNLNNPQAWVCKKCYLKEVTYLKGRLNAYKSWKHNNIGRVLPEESHGKN